MKKVLLPLLLLGLVFLGAGCSSAPIGTGLGVELAGIERTADGGATATVRIVNPNTVAYNVYSGTYRIALGNGYTGTFTVTKPTGIPAQSTGTHTGALTAAAGATPGPGEISYRLEARLELTLWDDQKETAKLNASGSLVVK